MGHLTPWKLAGVCKVLKLTDWNAAATNPKAEKTSTATKKANKQQSKKPATKHSQDPLLNLVIPLLCSISVPEIGMDRLIDLRATARNRLGWVDSSGSSEIS